MPQVEFFLRNPNEYHATFASMHEIMPKTTTAVRATKYILDETHSHVMLVSSPTISQGVYKTVSVLGSIKYAVDLAYKVSSGQRLQINVYDQTNSATIYRTFVADTSWKNFYKEVTTPSTCRLLRLKLLRATSGTGKPFYIDDVYVEGNALYADPDKYSIEYEETANDHTKADGSRTTDRQGRHARFMMGFPIMAATAVTRLMQAGKGAKSTYFNDGKVPVITEFFTNRATVAKTYSGVTVGASDKAYYTQTNAVPITATNFQAASFSNVNYANIGVDDSAYVTGAITETGHYGYHKFNFRVTTYGSQDNIKSFTVTYKGLAQDLSNAGINGVNLYAWNGYSWILVGRSRTPDKQTITFETARPEQAGQFVDVTNGYVRIIAATRATKDTSGTLSLKSYYVKVNINTDHGHSITLLNKAVLTAGGSVASVKNLTSNTTLTKDAVVSGYTVGEDRKKITVTSDQVSGSMIEVKYNQYYNVYIDTTRQVDVLPGDITKPRVAVDAILKTIVPVEKND